MIQSNGVKLTCGIYHRLGPVAATLVDSIPVFIISFSLSKRSIGPHVAVPCLGEGELEIPSDAERNIPPSPRPRQLSSGLTLAFIFSVFSSVFWFCSFLPSSFFLPSATRWDLPQKRNDALLQPPPSPRTEILDPDSPNTGCSDPYMTLGLTRDAVPETLPDTKEERFPVTVVRNGEADGRIF
ncbi:hypothetical protein VTN02DRAFT_996 [Thermoascus thermophilus]